jgi:hypothetical protein
VLYSFCRTFVVFLGETDPWHALAEHDPAPTYLPTGTGSVAEAASIACRWSFAFDPTWAPIATLKDIHPATNAAQIKPDFLSEPTDAALIG